MTNLETLKSYIEEVKPTEGNFSINYEWLIINLNMAIEADKNNLLINPEYLRAPITISFDGTIPKEPPVFDTW